MSENVDPSWAPVPEIVRLNFKALHDVVKAHGEALKSIEKAVGNKVSRPEHAASMQEKVSVNELTTTFEELSRVIDNKADARDTSAIVERMTSRSELQATLADKADVSEVQRCLDAKAGAAETQQLVAALESRLAESHAAMADEISSKAGSSSLEAEINTRCTHADVRAIVAEAVDAIKVELRAEMNTALETKASKASVATALKTKAARQDVEELLQSHADRMHASLAAKADVDAVSAALGAKASRAEVTELVDTRLDEARAALEKAIAERASERQLTSLQEEISRQLSLVKTEAAKAEEAAHAAVARVEHDVHTQAKEMHAALASKASSAELQLRARTSEVESLLGLKPDRSDIDSAVSAVSHKLAGEMSRAASDLRQLIDERASALRSESSGTLGRIGSFIERSEVETALKQKADTREVELWLQSKAGLAEVSAQLETLSEQMHRHGEGRVTGSHVTAAVEALEGRVRGEVNTLRIETQQALAPLASAAQVDAALQSLVSRSAVDSALGSLEKKANIDDINRSLTEVNRELAQRPTLAELNRVIGEQSLIMESLCSEHLLGRWIWKSGKIKGEKHAVPWNVQNINTNPENFVWEKDRCAITTVAPGLYEVTFGFFTVRPSRYRRPKSPPPVAPRSAQSQTARARCAHVASLRFLVVAAQEALCAASGQRRTRPLRRQLRELRRASFERAAGRRRAAPRGQRHRAHPHRLRGAAA